MNIKEFQPKNVNVEQPLENVVSGSGTFEELAEKVYDGTIIPLVRNDGTVVGISYDTKLGAPEDQVQGMIFSKKYEGHNVLNYFERAYTCKMTGVSLEEVIKQYKLDIGSEDEEEVNEEQVDEEEVEEKVEDELPSEVEIPLDYLDMDNMKGIKKYLKETYGHYLSGVDPLPTVEENEEGTILTVKNIKWGRKAY